MEKYFSELMESNEQVFEYKFTCKALALNSLQPMGYHAGLILGCAQPMRDAVTK